MKKIIAVLVLLVFAGCSPQPNGILTVIFFDVGQGDSSLIITPDKKTILIDCGEFDDAARYLGIMNITYLDVLIITHPDSDHAGGCDEVRKSTGVGKTITNENTKKDFKLDITKTAKFEIIVAYDTNGRYKDDNDNSVLLKLKYGKASFLFTGDCGWKCENEIMKTEKIDVDVLKVGHHGSKYSSSERFLEKTTPAIAIISVGKNSYGHPTNETLERLEKVNADVYRTDMDGSIILATDGKTYSIS
jgi:beta-lactamase superfamily II metal-dependent hydrolase